MIKQFEKIYNAQIIDEETKKNVKFISFTHSEIEKNDGKFIAITTQTIMKTMQLTLASKIGNGPAEFSSTSVSKHQKIEEAIVSVMTKAQKSKKSRPFELNRNYIAGSSSRSAKGTVIFYLDIESLIDFEHQEIHKVVEDVSLQVQPNPIGEGTFSLAYNSSVTVNTQKDGDFAMILKKSIQSQPDEYYTQGIAKNILSVYMAQRYNEGLRKADFPEYKRIDFVRSMLCII